MVGEKGGDQLAVRLAEITTRASGDSAADVGFMAEASYPDGTPVALVAALNNYGVPSHGQPPRPFMENAVAGRSGAWVENLGKAIVQTGYDSGRAVALVAEGAKADIQDSIRELNDPPLAESTVRAKGFPKPLIHTGHMLNSVTYRVRRNRR